MLDADAVVNNSSQKVGGSNAYLDPAPKKWVGPDPEKHIGSTSLDDGVGRVARIQAPLAQGPPSSRQICLENNFPLQWTLRHLDIKR